MELAIQLVYQWDHYARVFDQILDPAKKGPLHLGNPKVAQVVFDSLMWMGKNIYELICFCIIPHHVHKIVTTSKEVLSRSQERHKRFTAIECHKILELQGAFLQQ